MQNALNASTLNCSSHRSAFRRLCGFVGAAGAGPAHPRHCPRALTCKVASQSREALRDTIASKERRRAAHPELHDLRQSSQIFGPRGLLLIGFSEADSTAVEGWMHRMEPTFVVSHCTAPMLDATLEEAVCDKSSGGFRRESFVRVDEVLPRLVLLSGMTGEESVAIAEHWEHFTGSRLPIFATCVPKLWRRPLREVLPAIVKSYVSSGAQQTDPAEASGLRDMIRKKMEQRKAQVGRRLIGRDAPIVVPGSTDSAAGVGGQEHAGTSAAAEPDMVQSHERDQRAVFRQQLARDAALSHPAARPGRRRAEKRGEGRAAKRGFG